MALRNRVTPFSELIADPARGLVYGNRGCLHDARGELRRRYNGKRWDAQSGTYDISKGGSASGYVVYDGSGATVDGGDYNITVNASYVVVRRRATGAGAPGRSRPGSPRRAWRSGA